MWLKFADMVPVLRTESEASTTSSPTVFQKDKRLETYHRGGVDKGIICFSACSTSVVVYSQVRAEFIWGRTFVSIPYRIWLKFDEATEVKMFLK